MINREDSEVATTPEHTESTSTAEPERKGKSGRKRKGSSRRTSGRTKPKKAAGKRKKGARPGSHPAAPGKDGKLAKDGQHLIVVRVEPSVRKAAWRRLAQLRKKSPSLSMTSWVAGLIERASAR